MERITKKKTIVIPDFNQINNEELINEYLKDAECMELADRTVNNYRSCLEIFSDFNAKSLLDIGISDLKNFKIYLENLKNKYDDPFSPSTIRYYFSSIQSLYKYFEFEGYIDKSPVPKFRERYLREYKKKRYDNGSANRKLLTVEEMSMLVSSVLDPRDKAVILLLAKTGARREELSWIDITDIDWIEQCIHLKPTKKRTNLYVFFDDECARMLKRWTMSRENRKNNGTKALFLNERGGRLGRNAIYELIVKHATKVGLHNPNSHRIQDRFTTHCTRHWYTTWLLRNGMKREYVKELRGDARTEAIDIYHHIDREELRNTYLAHIPQLGI